MGLIWGRCIQGLLVLAALGSPFSLSARESWVCSGMRSGDSSPALRHFVIDDGKIFDKTEEEFLRELFSIGSKNSNNECNKSCIEEHVKSTLSYYNLIEDKNGKLLAINMNYVFGKAGSIPEKEADRDFVALFIDRSRRLYSVNAWSPFPNAFGHQVPRPAESGRCTLVN